MCHIIIPPDVRQADGGFSAVTSSGVTLSIRNLFKREHMKYLSIFVLLFAGLTRLSAAQMQGNGDTIISHPVDHDLYIVSGAVTINAPVHGDLIISGGTVVVNDSVTDDLLVAGGRVTINGQVGDDIRGVCGEIYVNNNAGGDVALVGGTITISPKATIGGNTLLAGGTVIINGTLAHSLDCRAGMLKYTGTTAGDIDCRGGNLIMNGVVKGNSQLAADDIVIGDGAAFYNNVDYWCKEQHLNFGQSMKQGTANYRPALKIESGRWTYLGFSSVLAVIWYLCAVMIFILLIEYLLPNTLKIAADEAHANASRSLLRGLLYFIGIPLLVCMLFITVIGIPLGLLLLFFYIILALLSSTIAAVFLSNWFNNRNGYKWSKGKISLMALAAFILLKLCAAIPLFGWVIMIVIITIAFGSLYTTIAKQCTSKSTKALRH